MCVLVGPQLKQYMSDFQEERQAREKMAEVKRLMESLLADKEQQITELRQHVTDLSSQVMQLRQELQVVWQLVCEATCTVTLSLPLPLPTECTDGVLAQQESTVVQRILLWRSSLAIFVYTCAQCFCTVYSVQWPLRLPGTVIGSLQEVGGAQVT